MGNKLSNPENMSIRADGQALGDSGDTLRCLLCGNIFQIPVVLECGHSLYSFCWECVKKMLDTNEDPLCPRCMKKYPDKKLSVSQMLHKAVREAQGWNLRVNSRASASDEKGSPVTGTTYITRAEVTRLDANRQEAMPSTISPTKRTPIQRKKDDMAKFFTGDQNKSRIELGVQLSLLERDVRDSTRMKEYFFRQKHLIHGTRTDKLVSKEKTCFSDIPLNY